MSSNHGVPTPPERGQFAKKMLWSDTYFFEKYRPRHFFVNLPHSRQRARAYLR